MSDGKLAALETGDGLVDQEDRFEDDRFEDDRFEDDRFEDQTMEDSSIAPR